MPAPGPKGNGEPVSSPGHRGWLGYLSVVLLPLIHDIDLCLLPKGNVLFAFCKVEKGFTACLWF